MNWMPIEGAPSGVQLLLHNAKTKASLIGYVSSASRQHGPSRPYWISPRNGMTIYFDEATHYAEITPPQVPLDWPNSAGWWWVGYTGGKCAIEVGEVGDTWLIIAETDRKIQKSDYHGHKFLPAPIPSFGGDDGK